MSDLLIIGNQLQRSLTAVLGRRVNLVIAGKRRVLVPCKRTAPEIFIETSTVSVVFEPHGRVVVRELGTAKYNDEKRRFAVRPGRHGDQESIGRMLLEAGVVRAGPLAREVREGLRPDLTVSRRGEVVVEGVTDAVVEAVRQSIWMMGSSSTGGWKPEPGIQSDGAMWRLARHLAVVIGLILRDQGSPVSVIDGDRKTLAGRGADLRSVVVMSSGVEVDGGAFEPLSVRWEDEWSIEPAHSGEGKLVIMRLSSNGFDHFEDEQGFYEGAHVIPAMLSLWASNETRDGLAVEAEDALWAEAEDALWEDQD